MERNCDNWNEIEGIPQVISVSVGDCFYVCRKEKLKILSGARHRWSTPSIAHTFDPLHPLLYSKTKFILLAGELVSFSTGVSLWSKIQVLNS